MPSQVHQMSQEHLDKHSPALIFPIGKVERPECSETDSPLRASSTIPHTQLGMYSCNRYDSNK